MADFEQAFQRLMKEEGVVLTDNPKDRGGQTFAGISRKNWPKWEGWSWIDAGDTPPLHMVRNFYFEHFWFPIQGDQIKDQRIADVLFGQYVNMGAAAIKLAQMVVGVIADGKIGPKTLDAIEALGDHFLDKFCIAMMARYLAIGLKDKSQRQWWPGWFSRALRIAS